MWDVPEFDTMSHQQVEVWIAQATPRQLWQAAWAGREWLASFAPETEDDESLIEAVRERLDMVERAYQLTSESGMETPL